MKETFTIASVIEWHALCTVEWTVAVDARCNQSAIDTCGGRMLEYALRPFCSKYAKLSVYSFCVSCFTQESVPVYFSLRNACYKRNCLTVGS